MSSKSQAIRRSALFHRAGILSVLAALVALWVGWGFTVDDALITARVAHHLATGHGHVYSPGGEVADAVTPLGWVWFSVPFARSGIWSAFEATRVLGAAASLVTAWVLGTALREFRLPRAVQGLVLGLIATSLPFGAWATAGMETPVVGLLVTVGVVVRHPASIAALSLAAAWRPELLPFCMTLALLGAGATPRRRLAQLCAVISLPLATALLRANLFGDPAPLAVYAKPSDLKHGAVYVAGGCLFLGAPVLLALAALGPRVDAKIRAVIAACVVHFVALIFAGGDWMALFRLFVPVWPSMLFAGAAATANAYGSERRLIRLASVFVSVVAVLTSAYFLWTHRRAGDVLEHRKRLITQVAPHLASSQRIGALDIGWLGAATPRTIIDFAGVTDRSVALLPGGHTSKQLPKAFLNRRQIDTLILLSERTPSSNQPRRYARKVEARVLALADADQFAVAATIGLGGTSQEYVVLKRSPLAVP